MAIMRYFLKNRSHQGVETPIRNPLHLFRMDSLNKKHPITTENSKESYIRLKACVSPEKHCLLPPAPTEIEEDEMFGLEAGLIQLPIMGPISDPYVLEEAVMWTRNEKLHEVARDLGLFEEEESKSTVDSHTIKPGPMRTAKGT